jgi:hypothetical protein
MDDDVGAPKKSDRPATRGSVQIMSRGEVMGCARWASAFAGKHKDHRYYELVEDTIQPDFVFRYFAIKDEDGSVRAFQPFFIIDQDLLLGTNTRLGGVIGFIRRLWPRFMKMRTLMVGCAAGEGHLDGAEQSHRANAEIHRHPPRYPAGLGDRLNAAFQCFVLPTANQLLQVRST